MSEQTSPAVRGQILGLIGITALAAGLRLAWIGSLPPGLYHDEAFNGLDALRVLAGERPIFFEANNGREPLFIYLTALSVGLLGRTPGALRIVSAIIGTLTVPAAYGMARSLWERHRLALLTAALAALNVWALNLSRIAFRAVLLPFLSAGMLAFLGQGLKRKPWAMVAAGAFCGLTL
ncbi:MAG: glycosyltransferase family 39 protein, partial [Chloroflexi bacterium]|nr:glycosyltransferase family 39 protein [Chloroflexota bacterium]